MCLRGWNFMHNPTFKSNFQDLGIQWPNIEENYIETIICSIPLLHLWFFDLGSWIQQHLCSSFESREFNSHELFRFVGHNSAPSCRISTKMGEGESPSYQPPNLSQNSKASTICKKQNFRPEMLDKKNKSPRLLNSERKKYLINRRIINISVSQCGAARLW